jgi:hypothetical protein
MADAGSAEGVGLTHGTFSPTRPIGKIAEAMDIDVAFDIEATRTFASGQNTRLANR